MADYNINKQSPPTASSPSGVKGSPYYSSPEANAVRVNAISSGDQSPKNNGNRSSPTNGYSNSSNNGNYSQPQLKGGKNRKADFKDNRDDDVNKSDADGAKNGRIRFDGGDKGDNWSAEGDTTTRKENYDRGFNGNWNADKVNGTGGSGDSSRESDTPGAGQGKKTTYSNNNNSNSTTTSPRKDRQITSSYATSRANTPRGHGEKRKIVGFDNSEKNTYRQSLGSCTDHVAEERPKFGAWQEPNFGRQRKLVDRLAPFRPPAPADPRFNTWVNHFEYYCKIGVNEKQTRKVLDESLRSNNYRTYYGQDGGDSGAINGQSTKSSSSFYTGYPQGHHRNNLLAGRPRTTPGRVRMRGGGEEDGDNNNNNRNIEMDSSRRTPRAVKSSMGERHPLLSPSSVSGRKTQRSRSDGHLLEPTSAVPGLDRRYMGLQSVREDELRDIVGRLTRMTSAYHAKFAPNPHVWCDNSPGAHMVIKRENTIA